MSAYRKLTARERVFVDHFVDCGVGTEAVRRIGLPCKRPEQLAWRYMAKPTITAAIAERTDQAIEEAGVRAVQLLRAIADTAYFDPIVLQDAEGNLKPLSQIEPRYRQSIVAMEVEEVKGGKGKKATRIKRFRFESRGEARNKLGEFMKLWVKRAELTAAGGQPLIPPDTANKLDTARRLAFLLNEGLRAAQANTPLTPITDQASDGLVIDDSTSNSK